MFISVLFLHLALLYLTVLLLKKILKCFFLSVQALEWIHDTGEFYLSTHTSTGSSIHHTQELLKEHEDFHITAKVRLHHSDDKHLGFFLRS